MNEQDRNARDEQFPLEAYTTVYEWIGKWAEVARDEEQRLIAESAYASLTAVGNLVLDVMRQMPDGLSAPSSQFEALDEPAEVPEIANISPVIAHREKKAPASSDETYLSLLIDAIRDLAIVSQPGSSRRANALKQCLPESAIVRAREVLALMDRVIKDLQRIGRANDRMAEMLRREKNNDADGRRGEVLQRFFERLDKLIKTEPHRCRDALLTAFAHQDRCDEIRLAICEISKRQFFRELPDAERRDFSSLWRRLLDEDLATMRTFGPVAKALRDFVL